MKEFPKEKVEQVVKYLITGGSSALLELSAFALLYEIGNIDAPVANIMAVVSATCYNFVMNRSITFKSTSNPIKSLILYLVLFCLNTAFSTTFVAILEPTGIPLVAVKLATMICIALWNFVLYKKVVFA